MSILLYFYTDLTSDNISTLAVSVRETSAGSVFRDSQVQTAFAAVVWLPRKPEQIVGQRATAHRRIAPAPLAPTPLLPAARPVVQI